MPRARAKAEDILEQLVTLRDSIENLVERARQVRRFKCRNTLPVGPTKYRTNLQYRVNW